MLLIGETLNSSSPSVRAALAARDEAWVLGCARRQLEAGVEALDCNASALGAQERSALRWLAELLERRIDGRLVLDSPDVSVLVHVGQGRRGPPVLNSVPADPPWPEAIVAMAHEGAALVVQLRVGGALPSDLQTRLAWAERAVDGAARAGIPQERLLLDPVVLPWGHDLVAGAPVLEFVERATALWPGARTLVGLSNTSWGFPQRAQIHRAWLTALRERGLGAVILGPFDPELMALATR
jgi:5-methyltetrahydrofolate--homocysteine methyltransferase